MATLRDAFRNPFPAEDPDRRAMWQMLVPRDIDAFVTADWSAVAGDFVTAGFTGLSGHFQSDPDRFDLAYPALGLYRDDWLRQAQGFKDRVAAGLYEGDPRAAIFQATRLEDIEITGDTALVRKKFDGYLRRNDGPDERMNWQTLYWCRREKENCWKIAGFLGYLPHIKE